MSKIGKERRKYERYGAEAKIHFHITFDYRTKVYYQIVDEGKEKILSKKYTGMSKDFSVEGICFTSGQMLEPGDHLRIEVRLEKQDKPVIMDGEVRWSRRRPLAEEGGEILYDTGVYLRSVNNKSVLKSIKYDESNKIVWSDVLETIMGNLKKLTRPKT